jgi:HEAT repeat protein
MGPLARDAVPVLVELLKDGNDMIRRAATAALGAIGPDAKAALAALRAALLDQDVEVRRQAAESIKKIEEQAGKTSWNGRG